MAAHKTAPPATRTNAGTNQVEGLDILDVFSMGSSCRRAVQTRRQMLGGQLLKCSGGRSATRVMRAVEVPTSDEVDLVLPGTHLDRLGRQGRERPVGSPIFGQLPLGEQLALFQMPNLGCKVGCMGIV